MTLPSAIPYCGLPPAPADLAGRWNLDPVLIGVMVAGLGLYLWVARRSALSQTRIASFCAGWLVALAALTSPLCALSVALFSARIGQHMVLTLVAAPLVALGEPFPLDGGRAGLRVNALRMGEKSGRRLTSLLRQRRSIHPLSHLSHLSPIEGERLFRVSPLLVAFVFTALLWFWHAPAPYAATFASPVIYWAMHLSLVGSAIWLWSKLLDAAPSPARLAAAAISMMQMGFLGALLTLAPHALYGPHQLTTAAWGLTPLQDQQLGGALMWAPGGLVFLAAALMIGRRWMAPAPVLRAAE